MRGKVHGNIRTTSRIGAPGAVQYIGAYVKHIEMEPLLMPSEASCSWGLSGPPAAFWDLLTLSLAS
eukprot:7391477-Pyramimonas_sp.AAC.1